MTMKLTTTQANAVSRVSGLVLINAMLFQEILAGSDNRVHSLQKLLDHDNPLAAFCDHWQYIQDKINYYPIFHIAREILLDLTADPDIINSLRELAETTQRVVIMRAALRHDLMGRIYHRLLADAKYLGTYYTSIPAATLLLKLALDNREWQTDFHDLEKLSQLRVVDLACGTGTLLMASADAISDNHISARAERGLDIDVTSLHRVLAEDILYGYDVLPSAIHLTASTLALRAPQIAFTKMNLFSLQLGGDKSAHRLGSIDFLGRKELQMQTDLFGAAGVAEQVTGKGKEELLTATIPNMDLCVMNPPFTRSVGGNLLFGSAPGNERKVMQNELKKLVQKQKVLANITAGLGSVFVATVDPYIKPKGRIALVLPKALLSGIAWNPTRELLRRQYKVDYIIASHDPQRWNFSESTSLSEVLLLATKTAHEAKDENQSNHVIALNLWKNPSTAFESLAIANSLTKDGIADIESGQGALEVTIGNKKVGEAVAIPWDELKDRYLWILPSAFAQSDLIRAAYHLLKGSLWLPGEGDIGEIELSTLGEMGTLGPDRRDIHDGFNLSSSSTAYPAFWGHDAGAVHTIEQKPNRHLSPLPKAKKNRSLRKAEDLWPLAGKVLIAERLRLNTQRLVSIRLPKSVLSNVWWPFSFRDGLNSNSYEKGLALWLNSTLGLLLLLTHRLETEGAWVDFKKPVLGMLPVLDLKSLSKGQLKDLTSAYNKLSKEGLKPLPEMNDDPVREEIDKTIARTLGLPNFSILRNLLAEEPVVCLRRL